MNQKVTKSFIDLMREGRAQSDPIRYCLFRERNFGVPSACALGAGIYAYDPPRMVAGDPPALVDDTWRLFELNNLVMVDPAADPAFAEALTGQGMWFPGKLLTVPVGSLIMYLNDLAHWGTEEIINYLLLHNIQEVQVKRTFRQGPVPEHLKRSEEVSSHGA
jgi:hypothetical protein